MHTFNSYTKLSQIPYQIRKLELLIKIACEDFWRKITFYQVLNTQSKKLCKLSTKKCLILINNNKKYTKQILFHKKLFWQEMLSTLCAGKQRSCWNSHLLPTASSAACSHESCSYPVQSTECKDKAVEDKWVTQDSCPLGEVLNNCIASESRKEAIRLALEDCIMPSCPSSFWHWRGWSHMQNAETQ